MTLQVGHLLEVHLLIEIWLILIILLIRHVIHDLARGIIVLVIEGPNGRFLNHGRVLEIEVSGASRRDAHANVQVAG